MNIVKSVLFDDEQDSEVLLPGAAEQTLSAVEMDQKLTPLLYDDDDLETQYQQQFDRNIQDLTHIIYEESKNIAKREAIYRSDLFYDMFPVETKADHKRRIPSKSVWCIPSNHPFNMLMDELQHESLSHVKIKGIKTTFVFWDDGDVQDTVDYLCNECKTWKLKIVQEKEEEQQNTDVVIIKESNVEDTYGDYVSVKIDDSPTLTATMKSNPPVQNGAYNKKME